ncbi:hypothetical protein [Chthonobacter albigriseus]|uniref:hypothetical protein n=1 Tax=Chthonobacter albigriseus TaxID=1683161 RepID=UPI0015EEC898|nr:hypothetical protein [Chthonobacter albigriseus]
MLTRRTASLARTIRDMVGAFEGAVQAAGAIDTGRKPSRAALVKLGIRPDAFDNTRLF